MTVKTKLSLMFVSLFALLIGAFIIHRLNGDISSQLDKVNAASPTSPSTLYVNDSIVGAQDGLTNPLHLYTDDLVFSAIFEDPDVGDYADQYQLQIATDVGMTTLVYDSNQSPLTSTNAGERTTDIPSSGFVPSLGTTYYWRIKFWDASATEGPYSTPSSFVYDPINHTPDAPTIPYANDQSLGAQTGVTNPTHLNSTTIVFSAKYEDIDPIDISSKYQLQISSDAGFSSIIYDSGSSGTSMTSTSRNNRSPNLSAPGFTPILSTTYYWRIKFWDNSDVQSPFSSTQTFVYEPQYYNLTTIPVTRTRFFTGKHAIAVGSDGFARILVSDASLGPFDTDSRIYICQNANCSLRQTVNIHSAGNFGGSPSLALDSSNRPLMTYTNNSSGEVYFASCSDATCSSVSTIPLGGFTSHPAVIHVGSDGFPRILINGYFNQLYIRCTSVDCSTKVTTPLPASSGPSFDGILKSDGFMYYAAGGSTLSYISCLNIDCTSRSTTPIVSTAAEEVTLTQTSAGLPRIIYRHNVPGEQSLRLISCSTTDCSSFTTQVLYSGITTNVSSVLAQDLPRVIFSDNSINVDKFIYCDNGSCSLSTTKQFTDAGLGGAVYNNTITLGLDGYPRIFTAILSDPVLFYTSQFRQCISSNCFTGGNTVPTAPTMLYINTSSSGAQSGMSNPTTLNDTSVVFSSVYNDSDVGDTANKYRIQVSTDSGFSAIVHDTGASGTSIASIAAGARSSDIALSGFTPNRETTYYWRIKFWDTAGEEGAFSTGTNSFFIADTSVPTLVSSTPVESTVDVVVTTPIRLTFRDTIGIPQTASVNISVNAQQAVINGVCQPAYTCTITPSGSDLLVDLSLNNASLAYSTNYRISYSVGDNATTPNMLNGSFLFTTALPPTPNTSPSASSSSPSVALPSTTTSPSSNSNGQLQNNGNTAQMNNSTTQLNTNGNSILITNSNTVSALNSNSSILNNNSNTYSSAGGGGASPETSLPQALQRFTGILGGQISFSYGANGLPTPDFVDNFKRVPVCSLLGSTEVPKPMFADAEDEPLTSYIATIISSGIHIEQDHDTFAPQATITRAEFLKYLMLGLCADFALYTSDAPTFTDLKQDHPHFFFIEEARRRGLITGYKDNTFKPDQPISRAEALAIMIRAYINGVHPRAQLEDLPFDDVRISNWFAPYVDRALEEDIIVIPVSKQFRPNDILNRAEIASLLAHVLEKRKK